jgi:hypothetical protein
MNVNDLSKLGTRELEELGELLKEYANNRPDEFDDYDVKWEFNPNSGYIFLVNGDYQVCMLNGGELEMWYTLPYDGFEGFVEDIKEAYLGDCITHNEDIEHMLYCGILDYDDLKEEHKELWEVCNG